MEATLIAGVLQGRHPEYNPGNHGCPPKGGHVNRTTMVRFVSASTALAGLALLPEPAVVAEKPKAETRPTAVFLTLRLADVAQMPPCTPLRIAAGGPTSPKTKLEHALDRWEPLKLKRRTFEEALPTDRFGDCLAAAAEYDGRYTDEQAEAFEAGRLTLGMPAEFALMLLGPPDSTTRLPTQVQSARTVSTLDVEPQRGILPTTSFDNLTEPATFKWATSFVEIQVDEAGRIARILLASKDLPALFVEGDSKNTTVSSFGSGVVTLSSRDEAHADYSRAMEAYRSSDRSAALETLLRLAEAGHAPSQYAVGDMFYQGDGVEKDLGKAAHWIDLAAASRLPGALYHLGFLQLRGEGIAQDPVAAYVTLHTAAELGNPDAAKVIERLESTLDPQQLATARERIEESGFHNPVLIHKVEPEYPELARVVRLEGFVVLQAEIGTDGAVTVVEVLHTSRPHMGFEEAAIAAVSRWRYEPARWRVDGEPVEVYFTIYVAFKLK